ncbi:MAG: ABC transporter ATP-binding protein [Actinomycetota bacterium]|nr:ABC transporter ATP-binding protein [Actinomycetota bacterium]
MSAGETTPQAVVELRSISKRFGAVQANDGINLTLRRGEVHGVLGENGAGKTTLMRILYGLTLPDSGDTLVDGETVDISSPKDAIAAGIGMVTQHFALVKPMTVTENVILGRAGGAVLDLERARKLVEEAAQRFGLGVQPDLRVADLSVGEQQRVEILKALYRDCRVLIMDEPTAVLTPQEVRALFVTLDKLRSDGMAIVFISHKLPEVMELTDRVSILRRGKIIDSVKTNTVDAGQLASLMVGHPTTAGKRHAYSEPGATVLEVVGLSARGRLDLPALSEVSFTVGAGEILGVAGVSGNGQTELAEVLSGMRKPDAGSIRVGGTEIAGLGPRQVVAAGVGRIPEDRHEALVGDMSVSHNLILEHLDEIGSRSILDTEQIRSNALDLIERFSIKAEPDDLIRTLSGGNIQKVLLARVLAREPSALVVSQPTRGLDIGATDYVRKQLLSRREQGAAILLISEDLDELLLLSDRIIVLYRGEIAGEIDAATADRDHVGLLMAGHTEVV